MADGILGLGSSGASGLNQELIDKLKAAERTATVEPIESDIESITSNIEKFDEVNQAVLDVLDAVRPFDWFVTGGVNAFEEKSASTTGTSVLFDATDVTSLNNGTTTVEVTQIGQKDVFQSNLIKSSSIYNSDGSAKKFNSTEDINISIGGGDSLSFSTSYDVENDDGSTTTNYYTYDELVKKINDTEGISASLDEVSSGNYRLVIKSEEVGIANQLDFSGTLAKSLGFTANVNTSGSFTSSTDSITTDDYNLVVTINSEEQAAINIKDMTYEDLVNTLNTNFGTDLTASIVDNTIKIEGKNGAITSLSINENTDVDGSTTIDSNISGILDFTSTVETSDYNHLQEAQDMKMTVDGVEFEAASNKIVVDGLTINATTKGTSTISIANDTSYLTTQMQNFVDKYNVLVEVVDDVTQADSDMYNKSGLKSILEQLKSKVLGTYGENQDKSLFSIGFGFDGDKSGKLTFDDTIFNQALEDDPQNIKDIFIGNSYYTENNPGGFGTQTKALLDEMFYSTGAVSLFEISLTDREETLNIDKEKAEETLDNKYNQLSAQFSAYASIITQFETAFGGLKMMIDQSIASN